MKARAITLLSILEANSRYQQADTNRTTLVKQAFLVENLKPLYDIWSQAFSFVRYNYGPYTEDIFHELDTLIFNGLVQVRKFEKTGGRIEAHYTITEFGTKNFSEFAPREMMSLTSDVVWALQSIGVDQAIKISKLVYQEPGFVSVLATERESGLGPRDRVPLPDVREDNNLTFLSLATIEGLSRSPGQKHRKLSPRELVRVYLELLASEILG